MNFDGNGMAAERHCRARDEFIIHWLFAKFITHARTLVFTKFPFRFNFNFSSRDLVRMGHLGLPAVVKNCTYSNQTQASVEIQCIPGYDGGLPQYFVLELVSMHTGRTR